MRRDINWINKKTVNYKRVEELLADSVTFNQMSNGGPATIKLANKVKDLLNISDSKSVVLTSNGTSALHALISALSVYYNKRLVFVTQAFTFPSSAQGSADNSVIVDIMNDNSCNPDFAKLTETVDTFDGITVTNIFGYCVNIQKCVDWCKKYNKLLIFDNAATPYTFYKGTNSCNYGDGSIISFHHTKPLGFGEGGAVFTDNVYYDSLINTINFGKDMKQQQFTWNRNGSNYKMSDPSAAFILQHLDSFYDTVSHHQHLYKHFNEQLNKKGLNSLMHFSDDLPFVACLTVVFNNSEIADKNLSIFWGFNIQCRKYYKPLEPLKNATDLYDRIVCFPCHTDVTVNDVNFIVDNIYTC